MRKMIVFLVMIAVLTGQNQAEESPPVCFLPTGRSAWCVPIAQCLHLQSLIANLQKPLPSDVSLLIRESFFCGSENGKLSVCCPLDGLGNRLGEVPGIPDRQGCEFQHHLHSACVSYNQCMPFAHLIGNLRKPILPAVGSIVRSSYMCGFSGQIGNAVPRVCCPTEGIVSTEVLSMINFASMGEAANTTEEVSNDPEKLDTTEDTEIVSITSEKFETIEGKEESESLSPQDLKTHPGREMLGNEYSCGISLVINRLEDGGPAYVGQYPWLVLLGDEHDYYCGGTIIGSRYVVTTAQCVVKRTPRIVKAGEHNQATAKDCDQDGIVCSEEVQDIEVEEVIVHPFYNHNKPEEYNIALIKLADEINENDFVSPICLNFEEEIDMRTQLDVAGWGTHTQQTRRRPTFLRFSSVNITSSDDCSNMSPRLDNLCITALNNKDLCMADTGGGLMRNIPSQFGEQWFLMGVGADIMCPTSRGFRKYTSITTYLEWILNSIRRK